MTLNCNGKLIDLSTPKVMGILNVTPDSFYDGGKKRGRILNLKKSMMLLSLMEAVMVWLQLII